MLRFIFFTISLLLGIYLNAQELNITIDQIHEINDLSLDTHIKCLAKDQTGVLWVGADNGLFRYDGYHLFKVDIPYIKDLLVSQNGNLLVIADQGLFKIKNTTFDWEIEHLIKGSDSVSDTSLFFPKTIFEDQQGVLWIAENQHIIRYKDGKMRRFSFVYQNIGHYLRHSFSFAEDGFGQLWIMAFNGLLYNYDRGEEAFVEVKMPVSFREVSAFVSDGKAKLWAGSYEGLFEISLNGSQSVQDVKQISNIAQIASIALWNEYAVVSSFESGLFQLNLSNYRIQEISSFKNLDVLDIVNENNKCWLASTEGIFVMDFPSFRTYSQTFNQFIPSVDLALDNSIIVNEGRKLYRAIPRPGGNELSVLLELPNELWVNDVLSYKNELWLVTTEGVFIYDTNTRKLSPVEGTTDNVWLNHIYQTSDGTVWISNNADDAVLKINASREVTPLEELQKVRLVAEHESNIFLLGDSGTFIVNTPQNEFRSYSINFPDSSPNIVDVAFSMDSIYIASNKGIFVFGKDMLAQESIEVRQITANSTNSIAVDKDGVIWFAHAEGLSMVKNGNQITFDRSDGLPSKYIVKRGLLIDYRNQVWVCTSKGLAIISPNSLLLNKTPSPILIECRENNQSIPINGFHLGQFSFKNTIGLAVNSLAYPAKNLIYQIELIENEKVIDSQTTTGVATFYDLRAGDYQTKIRAKQTRAQWSEPTTYFFSVHKKWYQTSWFLLLAFLLIVMSAYFLIQFYNKNLRQTNEKLERLVGERTSALESQKNELIRNQAQIMAQQRELMNKNEVLSETQKALTNSEIQFLELKREQMRRELDLKTKQLTTHALSILQKNQDLLEISKTLDDLSGKKSLKEISKSVRQISQKIKNSIKQSDRWEEFRLYFEQIHGDFYAKLKISFPTLTANDLKQCALVKLNLSLEESATLLGVSSESVRVSRYRIQKKMGLSSQAAFYEYLVKL